jgi:translocation and assembly module TamA
MKSILCYTLLIGHLCWAGQALSASPINVWLKGIDGKVAKNVTTAIENQQNNLILPIDQSSVDTFYRKAPITIKKAMQPFGYFNPTLQSSLTQKNQQWKITFNIQAGQAIKITQIDLKIIGAGQQDPAFQKFYSHMPIKIGRPLHTEDYEKTKQLLYDLASTRGYFDAKMQASKIRINIEKHQAKIIIHFQTGPRYRFGKTTFNPSPFAKSFLRRFLKYKQGKPYNYQRIEKTQKGFIDSNFFSQVIINPVQDNITDDEAPIQIKTVPQKRYAYSLGLGYGTDTGPRATAGFDVRRINRYGHHLKALIQADEQKNSNGTLSYYIPASDPATDFFQMSLGYSNFEQVTGDGKSFKLNGGYTTSFGRIQQTIGLTYLREAYNIVNFPFTKTHALFPFINWKYTSTEDVLHPKHGITLSAAIAASTKSYLSTASFSQARLDTKMLTTLFNATRLIFRASLARTQTKDLQSVPFSMQLFAGGARSIRGYRYNAIGPGRNLLTGSFEIQQRIKGNFYLTAFYDVGNVTDENPLDSQHFYQGVGPGLAWLSPVGLLEITAAKAISQPHQPWVIQFSMGPEL